MSKRAVAEVEKGLFRLRFGRRGGATIWILELLTEDRQVVSFYPQTDFYSIDEIQGAPHASA